jgi:hypothetical protein
MKIIDINLLRILNANFYENPSLGTHLFHAEMRERMDIQDEAIDHRLRDDPCSVGGRVCRCTGDFCLYKGLLTAIRRSGRQFY